jgi:hypothetical protein
MGAEPLTPDGGLEQLAHVVVGAGERAGIVIRVIGGVAIAIHAEQAREPALQRSTLDLDFVVPAAGRSKLDGVFAEAGFEPNRRFNALNGADRRIYQTQAGLKADVFLGAFRMCHVVPMDAERLTLDTPTAPLAELLVTKAQVVQLTQKDVVDLVTLLSGHAVGTGDQDVINAEHVADLCGRDWGLWRTVTQTLERVAGLLGGLDVCEGTHTRTADRIAFLREAIDEAPKSQKWKLRSRVGDRKVWYELPETPDRDAEVIGG